MDKKETPKIVSLVALGTSKLAFFNETMITGNPRGLADEVWVINKMGVSVRHDMLFRMDDFRKTYECNDKSYIGGNVTEPKTIHDTYDDFLKNHDKPIVTSKVYPEYPTAIEYPLEGVINTIGYSYFRTTPAYAAAFAIHIGVKQLRIFGCDFVYPGNQFISESGRANMEFILGIGMAMGMEVWLPPTTTLMDSNAPTINKMYGYYDPIEVKPDPENNDRWKVYPRPDLGDKDRKDIRLKDKDKLQKLLTKYRDEVKHDLIAGKWITKDDIDKQLLDAPKEAIQEELLKGEQQNDKSYEIHEGYNKCSK